MQNQRH